MKKINLARPDKMLLSGLNTLVDLPKTLYSTEKSESKGTGELTFIGEKKVKEVRACLYEYNEKEVKVKDGFLDFDKLNSVDPLNVRWLNFHGLHDVALIKDLGEKIALDRMTVRHVLDTTLRPKVEEYDNYLFFSIKSILRDEKENLQVEQLSFVLSKGLVVSLQEEVGDHFDHIRNKITEKLGLLGVRGADFLLYQLLDAILDNYFETIESMNANVSQLEKLVMQQPSQALIIKIEYVKQLAETVKKSLNPFKDALRVISSRESRFIDKSVEKYFSELTSTCSSAIEEINSVSQSLESLTNVYFSSLSQKMNETMKVLTTVSTIFIPLTFIAGIYGMNFQNMPELTSHNGYFIVLGVMGGIFLAMLYYFKRRGWL